MQDADLAVKELERCVSDLGLAGIEIGSHVDGKNLDDPSVFPVFEAAAGLGASVFVHPWDMLGTDRMTRYCLPWLVGMPGETAVAGSTDDKPSGGTSAWVTSTPARSPENSRSRVSTLSVPSIADSTRETDEFSSGSVALAATIRSVQLNGLIRLLQTGGVRHFSSTTTSRP